MKARKHWKQETEEHARRWKDFPMFMDWQRKIVKMAILSKIIDRFNVYSDEIPKILFFEIKKKNVKKIIWNHQRCHIDKAN